MSNVRQLHPRQLLGQRPRTLFEQALVLGFVLFAVYGLAAITVANLDARGIKTGFDFLWQPASLGISESWIPFSPGQDSYGRVLVAGAANTVFVSVLVIGLATMLGVVIGLSRLSSNWLLSHSAGLYVELIRNIPLPLQLLVWYQILLNLPSPRQAITWGGAVALSNRGLWLPTLVWDSGHAAWLVAFLILSVVLVALKRLANKAGHRPIFPVGRTLLILGFLGLLAISLVSPPRLEVPVLHGFNYQGGISLSPELTALVGGLTLYAAAFIAEIVRAGIRSVPAGQWEAAQALGLSRRHTLRLIVMPLSLRLIIPPLASEYLSTIKNSSLAVVIGYPELASLINTTMSNTGQPIEGIAILMLAYLTISVPVGMFMNWYNRRSALVTR